jgi:hypothetical protein
MKAAYIEQVGPPQAIRYGDLKEKLRSNCRSYTPLRRINFTRRGVCLENLSSCQSEISGDRVW